MNAKWENENSPRHTHGWHLAKNNINLVYFWCDEVFFLVGFALFVWDADDDHHYYNSLKCGVFDSIGGGIHDVRLLLVSQIVDWFDFGWKIWIEGQEQAMTQWIELIEFFWCVCIFNRKPNFRLPPIEVSLFNHRIPPINRSYFLIFRFGWFDGVVCTKHHHNEPALISFFFYYII